MPNPSPVSSPAGGATRVTKREVDAFCGEYKDAAECEVDDEGRDSSHEYFDPHRRAIRIALEAFVASRLRATPASPPREETLKLADASPELKALLERRGEVSPNDVGRA